MNSEFFDYERKWLERQPGFDRWAVGCERLTNFIWSDIEEISERQCGSVVIPTTVTSVGHFARYWACLSQHWQKWCWKSKATCDLATIVGRLREGRGDVGNLGGNPLDDVVLCEAVLQRDAIATERLLDTVTSSIAAAISSRHGWLAPSADDLTVEFFYKSAGYSDEKAPIVDTASKSSGSLMVGATLSVGRWCHQLVHSSLANADETARVRLQTTLKRHIESSVLGYASGVGDSREMWEYESRALDAYSASPKPSMLNFRGGSGIRRFLTGRPLQSFLADHIKAASNDPTIQLDPQALTGKPPTTKGNFEFSEYCHKLLVSIFRKVFRLMDRDHRTQNANIAHQDMMALHSRVLCELPVKDIAALLECDKGTASRSVHRGIKRLKSEFSTLLQHDINVASCVEGMHPTDVAGLFADASANTLSNRRHSVNNRTAVGNALIECLVEAGCHASNSERTGLLGNFNFVIRLQDNDISAAERAELIEQLATRAAARNRLKDLLDSGDLVLPLPVRIPGVADEDSTVAPHERVELQPSARRKIQRRKIRRRTIIGAVAISLATCGLLLVHFSSDLAEERSVQQAAQLADEQKWKQAWQTIRHIEPTSPNTRALLARIAREAANDYLDSADYDEVLEIAEEIDRHSLEDSWTQVLKHQAEDRIPSTNPFEVYPFVDQYLDSMRNQRQRKESQKRSLRLQQSLSIYPESESLRLNYAHSLLMAGEPQDAWDQLQHVHSPEHRVAALEGRTIAAFLEPHASLVVGAGDEALAGFTELENQFPETLAYAVNRAACLIALGDTVAAENTLRRAESLVKTDADRRHVEYWQERLQASQATQR